MPAEGGEAPEPQAWYQSPWTAAVMAYDPRTLEPLGLVRRPRSRMRYGPLKHLGGDLFAGEGSQTIELWRLRIA